jgi:5-methylcytosine-specific restriction endonuclease McrA
MMFPKPQRLVDPGAILAAWERDNRRCLICGERVRPSSVHHIVSRGAGGPDVPENLITLCRLHHQGAESGQYTPGELRQILSERYGYQYG